MNNDQDRIEQLNQKLESLLKKQESFTQELRVLYTEIKAVKELNAQQKSSEDPILKPVSETEKPPVAEAVSIPATPEPVPVTQPIKAVAPKARVPKGKSNWEKFIGENLINKIGIAITVIGVAIGAKYSIDNNLISPLTRIILGYLAGLGLLGFGIKLKAKYENYSAVLVSGALAILYFITFAAYSFYGLFPQIMAFATMLLFTIFGVVAALNYNKPVIAHIGLVGAYAVPFLLSNDSGNVTVLFTYMAIINIGILIISFKKYWKSLYYSAFVFTWLIYGSWRAFSYEREIHFQVAFLFLILFFAILYTTILAYKLVKSEKFGRSDVFLIVLNSFLFYGLGYTLLSRHETGEELMGLFTLANALVHFGVSVAIYRKKLADRNLFYLISGLVLVFITIAVPVQLDGNWVTLIWAFEAALLFWIGKTKNVPFYEKMAYPLMVLGFLSLNQDWNRSYSNYYAYGKTQITPFLNIHFVTSILFAAAFAFINRVAQNKGTESDPDKKGLISKIIAFGIPAVFLYVLYKAFYLEIENYWRQLYQSSEVVIKGGDETYQNYHNNYDLLDFGDVWLLNYTLLFLSILAFTNLSKLKNRVLGIVTLALMLIGTVAFLTAGLLILSDLRESYLGQTLSEYYEIGVFHIGIRYVAFAFFAFMLFALFRLTRQPFMKIRFKVPFEILLHISILWIGSSELLNWMDILGSDQSYKLGLSIFWGVYALVLIGLGIWKKKKYLRIGGIVLFAITLAKLFLYDIASLDTISKTIVFVSLGVLLLIVSFLYNKYKPVSDEHQN